MPLRGNLPLTLAAISDVGGRERNEDCHGAWQGGDLACCVVADGAGGHGGGYLAARIVVDTVLQDVQALATSGEPPSGSRLMRILLHANEEILEAQEQGGAARFMRSTAAMLAIDLARGTAVWAHCGDTRLYCLRDGQVLVRTQDHSMVQRLVDARLLSPDDARQHPRRNVLYSALGTQEDLEIAIAPESLRVQQGDAFLLCTDGFWGYADERRMLGALDRVSTPQQWLDALAAEIRNIAPDGHDNFTAMAAWSGRPSGERTLIVG